MVCLAGSSQHTQRSNLASRHPDMIAAKMAETKHPDLCRTELNLKLGLGSAKQTFARPGNLIAWRVGSPKIWRSAAHISVIAQESSRSARNGT